MEQPVEDMYSWWGKCSHFEGVYTVAQKRALRRHESSKKMSDISQ